MSCQQVPRLVEDPYTFTDTPATTAFFTTPIQKLVSSKSASTQSSKNLSNRYNGYTSFANGLSSNHHTPIYAKQPIYQQHTQVSALSPQQQPAQPTIKVAKQQSSSSLPPPSIYATVKTAAKNEQQKTVHNSLNHSNASFAAVNTATANAPSTPASHPHQIKQNSSHQRCTAFKLPNGQQFGPLKTRADSNFDSPISINGGGVSVPSNGIGGTGKSKRNSSTNARPFAKPKAETKVFIGKRLTTIGKPQSIGKTKRSYGQTSHHEPMQRIPSGKGTSRAISKAIRPKMQHEWHAPDSYFLDYTDVDLFSDDQMEVSQCAQSFWFKDIPNGSFLTREQRLEIKRDNLRRQAVQLAHAQEFRSTTLARKRLMSIIKALNKFTKEREDEKPAKCGMASCTNDALAMTAYCYLHITLSTDQQLFHPCTAKFSDNSQCRVPVFDISHELPLCREHAWKRDNYNRMLQEQKPKKSPRKKSKPIAMTRPHKRNKRKKRACAGAQPQPPTVLPPPPAPNIKQMPVQSQPQSIQPQAHITRSLDSMFDDAAILGPESIQIASKIPASIMANHFLSDNSTIFQYAQTADDLASLQQQELFTVCENSSAYESSEDTGVGGLSESELMGASDGIEIPLGDTRLLEEHDLTNVLNQLPEDAFNELFEVQLQQNEHYEPSQKEQDELARALEEVDEQVKSLEQMTGSSDFLGNFLDVDDEILVDDSDICGDILSTSMKNEIRGLVHT